MDISGSTVNGEFPLAPTSSVVTETEFSPEYEITVAYSVTPEENYAGPPGAAPPPPSS
jgi:hypothetical protein